MIIRACQSYGGYLGNRSHGVRILQDGTWCIKRLGDFVAAPFHARLMEFEAAHAKGVSRKATRFEAIGKATSPISNEKQSDSRLLRAQVGKDAVVAEREALQPQRSPLAPVALSGLME